MIADMDEKPKKRPWYQISLVTVAVFMFVLMFVATWLPFGGPSVTGFDYSSDVETYLFLHDPTLHLLIGVAFRVALLLSPAVTFELLIRRKVWIGCWRCMRSWSILTWCCCGTFSGLIGGVWFIAAHSDAPLGAGPTLVGCALALCFLGLILGFGVGVRLNNPETKAPKSPKDGGA
jgi:hypothetical protein